MAYKIFFLLFASILTACGFHLQGEVHLAPPLHRLYLQTNDPYGHLATSLKQYLKASKVILVSSPANADTILTILRDESTQNLLSVSGTQQTQQYNLGVIVQFEISAVNGLTLVDVQTLSENRTITLQSNQILGSSNEANLFYQQMRRNLAYAIMNRLASKEITQQINKSFYLAHQPQK